LLKAQETAALRNFDSAYDRFESKADLTPSLGHVSFASESRRCSAPLACPL